MSKVIEILLRAIRISKKPEVFEAESRLLCTHFLCSATCPIHGTDSKRNLKKMATKSNLKEMTT